MSVERFSLPLSAPLATAAGTIERREGFLVRIERDGVAGVGEATPLPGWTESLAACETALRSVAAADVLDDPGGALAELDGAPAARHGVSLALLDARARRAGEPLYRYLGRDDRIEEVAVNATVGDAPPAETADAAAAATEAGYRAVKVKVGAGSIEADRDRLAAVRRRCPDVELRADANGAWERASAERALEAFEPLDVAFVEQPLSPDDLGGAAALRRGTTAGVAIDEGVVEAGIEAILAAGAADVAVVKPMALGGIDRAREVALRARAAGVEPVVTTTIDGAVARAAAVHLAASLEPIRPCGLATGDRIAADLRDGVAPVRNGAAVVPQGKGNILPS